MTDWVAGIRCSVRVPATSANLGPGFDSLGLALGLYDVVEAEVIPEGIEIEVEGEGADQVPRDEHHLVVRALLAGAAAFGVPPPPGLRLIAHNAIPHGRGLGSSAAAVVAGVTLFDLLVPASEGPRSLLGLAAELEGHPDNAAAALLGGLTIAWYDETPAAASADPSATHVVPVRIARAARLQPHLMLEPVVLYPDTQLGTAQARSLLPDVVPHLDASRTAARAALLIHALTTDPSLLLPATEDWLHQRPRAAAMPQTLALVEGLRDEGYAAVVSGAGPSVLVLTVGAADGGLGDQAGRLLAHPPQGWTAIAPGIAHQGTRGGVVGRGSRGDPAVLH